MSFRPSQQSRRAMPSDFGGNPVIRIGGGTLKVWLRADLGVSLGGILSATGASPPPVTITGTATSVVGLHLEIDSTAGGTGLGQATFKWSVNNGTSYGTNVGILTAASVVLGTTGITAQFPVGPYNANNKYDATIAARADQSGQGNDLSQATPGLQPLCIVNAVNGKPSVRWDGVDDLMAAVFTLSEPCTIVVAMKLLVTDGNVRSAWDGAPAANVETMWTVFKAAQTSIVDSNVVVVTSPTVAVGAYHVITGIYNHVSSSLRIDRSATSGTLGAASATIGGLTLGGVANAGFPLNFDDAELALYSSVLSSADLAAIENYMKGRYATP